MVNQRINRQLLQINKRTLKRTENWRIGESWRWLGVDLRWLILQKRIEIRKEIEKGKSKWNQENHGSFQIFSWEMERITILWIRLFFHDSFRIFRLYLKIIRRHRYSWFFRQSQGSLERNHDYESSNKNEVWTRVYFLLFRLIELLNILYFC